jgi:CubicO group peptidase (beta-lactamase class C family)
MLRSWIAAVTAAVLCIPLQSCKGPAQATPSASLSADTPRTTPAGTQFIAPAGWTIQVRPPVVVLDPPEPGSHIVLVDVTAKDADAAVAAAWAAYAPARTWPLKTALEGSPRDDWEQIRHYDYETSANDKRSVGATVYRRGGEYTVAIVDMDNAVGEKRGSQERMIFDRLLPKGYTRESFAGKTAHPLDAARVEQLKQFVEESRKELDVPGVAIGLIDHGKVVFAGGFGVRELGKPDAVDADTLFMIASNTKALTTLMLARLVDQKKFGWDTPVTQVLPSFKLGDADTTSQVLIKHLICACTGLPRQDLEWLLNSQSATPESVLAELGTMQPTSKFGQLFQYSNLMAAAAGYVGAHSLYPDKEFGVAYDAAMQKQVFGPLGMKATTFDEAVARKHDHATPHALDVDGQTRVAGMGINEAIYAARPAGAAWSSVDDLLRYVQMELANGVLPDGSRYVSEQNLLERRRPQVALGSTGSYGMGLMVDHTWGVPVVHHGGDLTGFHSDMIWLPEQQVGAVILTNADNGVFIRGPLQRRLLEVLFDGRPIAAATVTASAKNVKAQVVAERKRLVVPADSSESAKLGPMYRNASLGHVAVSRADGKTSFDFGAWRSEVASRKNDDGSLSFVTISPGEDGLDFVVANGDKGPGLVIRDGQHEYRYAETK